jgi:hypothetical protein
MEVAIRQPLGTMLQVVAIMEVTGATAVLEVAQSISLLGILMMVRK